MMSNNETQQSRLRLANTMLDWLLDDLSLTQSEASDVLGVSPATIIAWRSEDRVPNKQSVDKFEKLRRIRHYLPDEDVLDEMTIPRETLNGHTLREKLRNNGLESVLAFVSDQSGMH